MDDITALRDHYGVEPPTGDTMQRERARLDELIIAAATPNEQTPITTDIVRTPRPRRKWMIVAAVPAAGLLAAAGWALMPRDATSASATTCQIAGDDYGFRNDGTPPTDACAQVWLDIGSAPELSSVPPLTTCVRNVDGIAAIVVLEDAGTETCADAGFAAWTGQSSVLDAGRALDNALVELGVDDPNPPTPDGCIDEATWQEQLRRSFDAEGLANWTIDVTYNDSNPLCFRVMDLNPTTETIWLDQSQG